MGLLNDIAEPFSGIEWSPLTVALGFAAFLSLTVVVNVLQQLLIKRPTDPPLVFHWFPFIGSTITYGMNPVKFFLENQQKYGDCFTFILIGKKTTVYVGAKGNEFILNGKHSQINAEDIYNGLCKPVFGKDVVYDCPNSKLMEQKKFVKFGLTTEAFNQYTPQIEHEIQDYVKRAAGFKGNKGAVEIVRTMAEMIIFTASRTLQGKEVRELMDSKFADVYHDLDMGFAPINFKLHSVPLPLNRRRDAAHQKMIETYSQIIEKRRANPDEKADDMISNLMSCKYKDGSSPPNHEVAGMMIALLMGGQHSSASTTAWALLHIAERPDVQDELLAEQKRVLGEHLPPLQFDDLAKLTAHANVIKETLRMHSPIHSILRAVKQPIPVEGTPYIIPTSHQLLAAPIASSMSSQYFPNPTSWQPQRWDARAEVAVEEEEKMDYGYGLISKGANSPYLPFGAGRHRCIGEQFAYLQMQTILATLVREFKFSWDPTKPFTPTDYTSLFSRPLPPAMLHWERREKA